MNWSPWLVVAPIGIIAIVALALKMLRYSPTPAPPAERAALLVALATCGTTLLFIGAEMIDLGRDVTVVDIAALAVTGILTGCFLTLALKPARKHGGKA